MRARARFHFGIAALVSGAALCTPLWAGESQQTLQAVTQSATPSTELEEVVVTATKRATDVQATPISMSVATSADIASRGLLNLNNLVESTPSLAIRDMGGPSMYEFEIRGLTSEGGNSSMVGQYIDEIPLATATGSQFGKGVFNPGLYDLNRVEVLLGPQGTLYGSSSMGGTIRLIPNDPQLNTYAATVQEVVSYTTSGGNINQTQNAMLNLPLGDTAAVRIVGSFYDDSGWVQRDVIESGAIAVDSGAFPIVSRPANFYTAPLQQDLTGVNTSNGHSIRAILLWNPTDNLTIQPTALYQYDRMAAPPSVDVNGYPTHPTTPQVWAHYEPFDSPEPQTNSLSFGSLKMVYHFPDATLTSATGYFNRAFLSLEDVAEGFDAALGLPAYEASAGGIGNTVSDRGPGLREEDSTRQLSQELRITSNTPLWGHLNYVFGYFYQDLHSNDSLNAEAEEGVKVLGGPYIYVEEQPEVIVQNAVYGNLTWRFSPHWELQAGFRHYHYSLSAYAYEFGVFSAGAPGGNSNPFYADASIAASGTIPSATLTFNIDSNHMIYATAAEGFRLGGVSGDAGPIPAVPASNTNPLLASGVANECAIQAKELLTQTCNPNIFIPAPVTYNSDSVWSYEIGEKSSFFNHQLIVNLDGYLENWQNPQEPTELAGFGLSTNGANARIWGVDLQTDAILPRGFRFTLNGSYVHSEYLQNSPATGFLEGMAIPDTPQWSGTAILHWDHKLAGDLSLSGLIEGIYTGTKTDLPFGVTATLLNVNQVLMHMPAYTVGNLRFGLDGGKWNVMMFVNNFTNNHSLVDPQPNGGLQTSAFTRFVMLRPLTAGLDINYRF